MWQELKPAPPDLLSELPSVVTTNKLAFRLAIEKHSFWTDSSGASIGQTRLSDGSFGPGSCRAYYDVQSNLSQGDAATKPLGGRLYVTSDTSRLFCHNTINWLLVGSKNAIVYGTGSQETIATNTRVVECTSLQSIVATSSGTSYAAVAFPVTYTTAPAVFVTQVSNVTIRVGIPSVLTITTSGFSVAFRTLAGDDVGSFYWRSHGTVLQL